MATIRDLSFNDTPQLADQVPLYSSTSGVTQRTSVNQLLASGLSNLPTVQPVNGSGELWIDPLDGNSIKVAGPGNSAAASNLTQTVTNLINGTATDAGVLTGAENVPMNRSAGLLQTSLTKIAQWVIQTYQGFTQSGAGAVAATIQSELLRWVHVEQYGAVAGSTVTDAQAAANVVAFQAALDEIERRGGGEVRALAQYYVLAGRILIGSSVKLRCAGNDYWDPIYPQNPKLWGGTSLIFKSAGNRDILLAGITSMKYSGGWRANPDTPTTTYKLTSYYNSDASGTTPATPRLISAGIVNKMGAHNIGLENVRIVPWSGVDGTSDYSNQSATALGADIDVGVLLLNTTGAEIRNAQIVGYWRDHGALEVATAVSNSNSERNRWINCKWQGRIGFGRRGMDRWAITATTTNSVSIYWSEESYWASSGTFVGTDGRTYSYTGTSRAGTALTFTGVTPDPTTANPVIFEVRHSGVGFANGAQEDSIAYSLCHTSGMTPAALGLADSKPIEESGFPLRGAKHKNVKMHTDTDVMLHLHDTQDSTWLDPQVEGGSFVLASPAAADATWASAPCGETRNLVMVADVGTDTMDRRLFIPRSGYVQGLTISPRSDLTGNTTIESLRTDKDLILQLQTGRKLIVQTSTGTQHTFFDSGNFSPKGNVFPPAGSTYSLGGSSSGNWWNFVYATRYYVNGVAVVGPQQTGYGTPTNGGIIASFPGSTATLAQCGQMISQIVIALKTHGLLGA